MYDVFYSDLKLPEDSLCHKCLVMFKLEKLILQEIQELILSWKDSLHDCDRIFLKSPSYNKGLYFSGKNSPLTRSDTRIRQIPFVTRRPTFSELHRVHEILAAVHSYGKFEIT